MKNYILGLVFCLASIYIIIYHTLFQEFLFFSYSKLRFGRIFHNLNNSLSSETSVSDDLTITEVINIETNYELDEIIQTEIPISVNHFNDKYPIFTKQQTINQTDNVRGVIENLIRKICNQTNTTHEQNSNVTIDKLVEENMKHLFNENETNEIQTENKSYTKLKPKYLVNTKGCSIIWWPVFDLDTKKIFVNTSSETLNCSAENQVRLTRVNGTFVHIIIPENSTSEKCFASVQLLRGKNVNGDSVNYDNPIGPLEPITEFPNAEFVKISCFNSNLTKNWTNHSIDKTDSAKIKDHLLYEQIVPLIPHLSNNQRMYESHQIPNILLLGLDSISRLHFERHFSRSKILLKEKGFHSLYGYNKVGLNTFPNMFPLLTGNHPNSDLANESISNKLKFHFDKEPLIWKEYSAKNFRTFLLEDWPRFTIFNYLKKGFKYKPTDYYLRPFVLEINREPSLEEDFCYKGKMENELYYDYVYDFVTEMKNRNENYFALVFLAHLTHNYANNAGYADIPTYQLLKKLFDENLLNNTILMFFADHGIRYGKLRLTHSGEIEAKLPFFHIYLPKSVSDYNRNNLIINKNRLTTPFDIHATLLHIIKGFPNDSLPFGKTLFEVIPENRTCAMASIPDHFCACHEDVPLINSRLVKPFGQLIVNKINLMLKNHYDKCHKLFFEKIIASYVRNISHERQKDRKKIKVYLIQISVIPSNAIFEASVRVKKNSKPTVVGDISRLNQYGNQSYCIKDLLLERFCCCKY